MKGFKTITLLMVLAVMTSCVGRKLIMSEKEIAEKGYSVDGWNVKKNDVIVGVLTSTEWEIYRNRLVREISVETSFTKDEEMKEIAMYLHTIFPEAKIEVNDDKGNSFPEVK